MSSRSKVNTFYFQPEKWQEYYNSSAPHSDPLPHPWDDDLMSLQKLVILRCLRPDKVRKLLYCTIYLRCLCLVPTFWSSSFQPSSRSGIARQHSIYSRTPCSHISTREMDIAVDHSICATSGGTPGLFWQNSSIVWGPCSKPLSWSLTFHNEGYRLFSLARFHSLFSTMTLQVVS